MPGKLEEAEKGPSLEASEEAWLCQYPTFRLLASRMVRQYISVVEVTQCVVLVKAALGN